MAEIEKPIKGKMGGRRPGAGRPLAAATILRNAALADRDQEAQKSLDFCIALRDNVGAKNDIRLAAAKEIMDRVWGRPKQSVEHSGTLGIEELVTGTYTASQTVTK
ncbi:MAG: hypothetical protein E6Q97_37365 [Desulfurellales bacterium]|nr:MAG: hypothetical protein E6Q97_37365 [Desulfurellales bacterium]